MRSALEVVEDLKNRYIDLPEYKRHCAPLQFFDEESNEKDLSSEVRCSVEKTEPSLSASKEHLFDKEENYTMETPCKLKALGSEETSSVINISSPSTQTETPLISKPSSQKRARLSVGKSRDRSTTKRA